MVGLFALMSSCNPHVVGLFHTWGDLTLEVYDLAHSPLPGPILAEEPEAASVS